MEFSRVTAYREEALPEPAGVRAEAPVMPAGWMVPVIRWAVVTTCWSALQSDAERLPHHTEIQLVSMLSIVQR